MQFSISSLTTERKWRAVTGLTHDQFNCLLQHFKLAYTRLFDLQIAERDLFSSNEAIIKTEEDLLLFTLFSFKADLTYDLLGFVSGMDTSNAKRYQDRGINVLKEALAAINQLPKREFSSVAEFEAHFKQQEVLFIDGTEQRTQRPQEYATQKEWYSGKKNDYAERNSHFATHQTY